MENQKTEDTNINAVDHSVEQAEKPVKKYAGFWRRLASYTLEQLIFQVGPYVAAIPALAVIAIKPEAGVIVMIILVGALFIGLLIWHIYLYFAKGKSLGYLILGLKIVDQETEKEAKAGRLFLRFFIKFGWMVVLFVVAGLSSVALISNSASETLNSDAFAAFGFVLAALYLASAVFVLVDNLFIPFSAKKRALHDRWSKTVVLNERNVHAAWVWIINSVNVIVFVGIIATVVLASFGSARQKAQDAYLQSEQQQAEINEILRQLEEAENSN